MGIEELNFLPHTQSAEAENAQAEYEAAVARRCAEWADDPLVQHVCKINGCAPEEVSPSQRRAAKMFCFAELYSWNSHPENCKLVLGDCVLSAQAMAPRRVLHDAVSSRSFARQESHALQMLPAMHLYAEKLGLERVPAGMDSYCDAMFLPVGLGKGEAWYPAPDVDCMRSWCRVDYKTNENRVLNWHPTAERDHAPLGVANARKVAKARAARKAAKLVKKRSRK